MTEIKECNKCGAPIWLRRMPNGAWMPCNIGNSDGPYSKQFHKATCAGAKGDELLARLRVRMGVPAEGYPGRKAIPISEHSESSEIS